MDVILVGDSLGMVIQGHDSTLPVIGRTTLFTIAAVSLQLRKRAFIVADMPFASYATPKQAIKTAARLMQVGWSADG